MKTSKGTGKGGFMPKKILSPGTQVRVTHNHYGHDWPIGEVITLGENTGTYGASNRYKAVGSRTWITDSEFELVAVGTKLPIKKYTSLKAINRRHALQKGVRLEFARLGKGTFVYESDGYLYFKMDNSTNLVTTSNGFAVFNPDLSSVRVLDECACGKPATHRNHRAEKFCTEHVFTIPQCTKCGVISHSTGEFKEGRFYCSSCAQAEALSQCLLCAQNYTERAGVPCSHCQTTNSKCSACGHWHPNENMQSLGGKKAFCQTCYAARAVQCDGCGEKFDRYTSVGTYNGRYVCPDCRDSYYLRCKACGYLFHEEEQEEDAGQICPKCASRNRKYISDVVASDDDRKWVKDLFGKKLLNRSYTLRFNGQDEGLAKIVESVGEVQHQFYVFGLIDRRGEQEYNVICSSDLMPVFKKAVKTVKVPKVDYYRRIVTPAGKFILYEDTSRKGKIGLCRTLRVDHTDWCVDLLKKIGKAAPKESKQKEDTAICVELPDTSASGR
jgi:hypothetical protein